MKKNKLIRLFFNKLFKIRLPEMVQYWKTGDMARAKLTTLEDGSYGMFIEGEKYPLYGFPRGPVLFGPLAQIKHLAKNVIFNQSWKLLEEKKSSEEVMSYLKSVAIPSVIEEIKKVKYDMFPVEKMCPAVRELWRAMTVVEQRLQDPRWFRSIKEGVCFFFQEDDAYRFRLQWLAKYGNPKSLPRRIYRFFTRKPYSLKDELKLLFKFMGEAEITPDMKGRIILITRILLAVLEDKDFGKLIEAVAWELDWKKLKLSKSDVYYFRGKYFKVDHAHYDY